MDFPIIRDIIEKLDHILNRLATTLPHPEKITLPNGGFRWSFPIQSPIVVQISKSVRIVSGIRAAMQLADTGYITECYTIIRTISDFSSEITFIAEGIINGSFNSSQQKFINQFFLPFPTDPEEIAKRESEKYVSRKEIIDAKSRLARRIGIDGAEFKSMVKGINKAFDSYVHGAYETSMELFSGKTHSFMLNGHESDTARCRAKIVIALKIHEILIALEFIAGETGIADLSSYIVALRKKLETSNEYNSKFE